MLLYHEQAFVNSGQLVDSLQRDFRALTTRDLLTICLADQILPLAQAVRSYFFNSQLVTLPDQTLAFIAPAECREQAAGAIEFLRQRIPAIAVHFIDVRESMRNGGGPACLRLRVTLTPQQQAALHPGVRLTDALHARLRAWISRHYRESLAPADLADPHLLAEVRTAMAELPTLGVPSPDNSPRA
jgi:succinylarginine dihydrolase